MTDFRPPTRYHRYYDFSIENEPVGFFEIEATVDRIYQRATFVIDDAVSTNEYVLRIDGGDVTAFRTGEDTGWQDMAAYGADAYPLSAYPLLLPTAGEKRRYRPIDEGTGAVEPERVLQWEGDTVVEIGDDEPFRSFTMQDSVPIEIDWGGAISTLGLGRESVLRDVPVDY